ncbi:MAG: hypothetical protein ACKOTZ_13285 [Chloroflexota bacterium]
MRSTAGFLVPLLALTLAAPPVTVAATPDAGPAAWTVTRLPPVRGDAAYVRHIAAGPAGLVAIGLRVGTTDGQPMRAWGEVWRSADGVSWTAVDPVAGGLALGAYRPVLSGPETGLIDVAAGPDGFVLVGRGTFGPVADRPIAVWRSPDGATWTRTDARFPAATRPTRLVRGSDGYLLAGVIYGERAPRAAVWSSPDGRMWTRAADDDVFGVGGYIDTMEDPASGGIGALTAVGGGALAVGLACFPSFDRTRWAWSGGCWGDGWVSPDGTGWADATLPQTAGSYTGAAALGTRAIVTTEICPDCPPAVLVADIDVDGDGAPDADAPWRVAYGAPVGGRFLAIAAGADAAWILLAGPTGGLHLWRSADGERWAEVPDLPAIPGGATWVAEGDLAIHDGHVVIVASVEAGTPGAWVLRGPAAAG